MGEIDKEDGGFVFSSLVPFLGVDRELGFTDLAYAECSRTSGRVLGFGQPTFWALLAGAPKPPRTGLGKPNAQAEPLDKPRWSCSTPEYQRR